MKIRTHDNKGYPLNYNPSTFYKTDEVFVELPPELYDTNPGDYFISNWGRIYNVRLNSYIPRELIPSYNRHIVVIIKDRYNREKTVKMHHAVAYVFCPKPAIWFFSDMKVINHKDDVRWHNEPYNLEIVSQSENIRHAVRNNHISRPFGEDNGWSALTDEQYRKICELTQSGYFPNQINSIMNLGRDITNICQKIRMGKSEIPIAADYDFSNIPKNDYRKFTESEVRQICLHLQDHPNMKPIEILADIGYDVDNMDKAKLKKYRDTISTIKRRVSYIEIGREYSF